MVVGYGGGWLTTDLLAGGVPSAGPEDGFRFPPGEWRVSWLTGAEPHSGTTFEMVGSTGVAVLVIVVCLVLRRAAAGAGHRPVAAVGALALSVYTVARGRHPGADGRRAGGGPGALDLGLVRGGRGARRGAVALVVGRGPLEWLLTWTSSRAAGLVPPSARAV